MTDLQKLKDSLARRIGGHTKAEAHAEAVCVFCGKTGSKDKLSKKECGISGLCQECQDDFFAEE